MTTGSSDAQLFEETFDVDKLLGDGKYDRVERLRCTSADTLTTMELDINKELFPVAVGERLRVVLATTLALDGSKDDGKSWRDVVNGEPTLADSFAYVCHGKIYKFEDGEDGESM
jgi:DNA-directed RNA polymerases I, II, and III subunit RPABC3